LLNDTSEISGIYDSGSNVSLINSKLLCLKKNPINKNKKNANLKTINGVKKTIGMVTLKIKIFDIEKSVLCDQNLASDSSGLSGGFRGIGRGFGFLKKGARQLLS
jgi:hypothetical protein